MDSGRFTFHPKCKDLGIILICFAGDLFSFCHPSAQSFQIVFSALLEYHNFSGVQPNENESKIYIAGLEDKTKVVLCSLLGFQLGTLLVKYLGVRLNSAKVTLRNKNHLQQDYHQNSRLG